jgi:orotate phosphoribosyltransferase
LLAEERDGLQFDMIFGPAYKGIRWLQPLPSNCSRLGPQSAVAYSRKETKDHGEGGTGGHTGQGGC